MLHLQRKKMLKPAGLLTGFLLCTTFIFSQSEYDWYNWNQYDHDSKPYYFGITLGANVSRYHIEHHPRFLQYDSILSIEPKNSPGFSLGLAATGKLTNRFEARFNPQLIFTERNLHYKLKYKDRLYGYDVNQKIESVIISFPFQVKFNSDRIGNFRVYMLGGVKVDIDMAANARARRAEDLVKMQKTDYGVELGLGFNFYFPSFIFSPEIKVSNGLRNIHSRDESLKYSNVLDVIQSRMIMLCIHLEG